MRYYKILLPLALLFITVGETRSQDAIEPTHRDLAYDSKHESQKLDAYLTSANVAAPVMIYIHGGGWQGGTKNRVPAWLTRGVTKGDFSVVSVEYRFTHVATHPAQTNDCLRAIQFVRHHAADWNVDPSRIGVTGGSAGGHLSAWVALHDDVADATSDDPIKRLSSRVCLAVPFAGPTDWSLIRELPHQHPAYRRLIGADRDATFDQLPKDLANDVSPIFFVSSDDPPMMIVHGDADEIVPVEHAKRLHQKMVKHNLDAKLVIVKGAGHAVAGAGDSKFVRQAEQFVREHFRK